jgi:hypothetical protein
MSEMQSAVFNGGHQDGPFHEVCLEGYFNRRDAPMPSLVAWKRQRTVCFCSFINKIF